MRNISLLLIVLSINCAQTDTVSQQGQVVEQLCPDDRCGQDGAKSAICHLPPGNPENAQDLCIADSAVPAHFEEHEGDSCGACPVVEEPGPDAGVPEEPTCEELNNCPPTCGDQSCDEGETCGTCPSDCGECEPEVCVNPEFCGASLLCCEGFECNLESECVVLDLGCHEEQCPEQCYGSDCWDVTSEDYIPPPE